MIELNVISGTDRPGSNAMRVSHYLKSEYTQFSDVSSEIIDLQNFPLRKAQGGPYGKGIKEIDQFANRLLDADGLCVVVPEYNGGYPGILKLVIDYLPYPSGLEKMPICFVGEADGAFGALRAVEQLQQVFSYRNALIYPERVYITRINENFDEQEGVKDSFQQQLLENQIRGFVKFVSELRGEIV